MEDVIIHLTQDQAIVLLDLLSRWSEEDGQGETPSSACCQSTAEGAALNAVNALLEKQVVAVFESDYERIVSDARSRLANDWSYPTLRG